MVNHGIPDFRSLDLGRNWLWARPLASYPLLLVRRANFGRWSLYLPHLAPIWSRITHPSSLAGVSDFLLSPIGFGRLLET